MVATLHPIRALEHVISEYRDYLQTEVRANCSSLRAAFQQKGNGIRSWRLIFVDIANVPDSDAYEVMSIDERKSLVRLAECCLGITPQKPLMKYVHHIHVDVHPSLQTDIDNKVQS